MVRQDSEIDALLDQFVCVRLVRMDGVDLQQFQFDYDQTWSAMFLLADGTVLGRYGTRNAQGPMAVNSVEGLKHTMQRVLQTYANWPADRELFLGKRGPATEYKHVEDIPSDTIRQIASRKDEASCVHCHNVYDAERDVMIQEGEYDPRRRWKYPPPENLGLIVEPTSGTRISNIVTGSPAQRAGVRAGDEMVSFNDQRIFSIADIQFVLHFLPPTSTVKATLKRNGELRDVVIRLTPGWRDSNIGWRASMYGMPPRPGLWVQTLEEIEKRGLGIPPEKLALKVRGVFGREVKLADLKPNDVIVRFGDVEDHLTDGQFHAALRLDYYRPNSELPLQVLRGGQEKLITVRFSNQ